MKQHIPSQGYYILNNKQRDFILFIEDDNEDEAINLLEQYNLFYAQVTKDNALLLAVQFDMVKLANILINKGASVNASDNLANTPLMFAAEGENIECVKLLLSKGAAVNTQNHEGNTALMLTMNCNIIKLLIKEGADINISNNTNRTALNIAIENEKETVTELLVKEEAKVNMIVPISHSNKNFACSLYQGSHKGWVNMIDREDEIKLRNLQFF